MTFEQWLAANGYDVEALNKPENAKQRKHLEAAFKAETQPPPPKPPEPKSDPANGFDAKMAAIEVENDRVNYIQTATAAAAERAIGNTEKLRQLREMCAAAIADKTTDKRGYDLALLRVDRSLPAIIMSPSTQHVTDTLLEAAVCMTNKLPNVEKRFDERTLQAAHSRFRHGLQLQELLMIAAERNGNYRGSPRDYQAMCRAAFFQHGAQDFLGGMRAEVVPSTISVSGILSNVANKFLATMFLFSEQSWRKIAKIRNANDFKQITTYRLTGANKFEKVPAGGEIKSGTLGELTYTNQVDTYGKILGIDRRDIINDDLGAFTGAASDLARGAGDSLNEVFWTEFLDDAAFFPTDKSKANYDDGATDSVLSMAGLENADTIFSQQTKPDGTPLGVAPAILLVPRGLRATARNLMNSTVVVGQGSNAAVVPDGNVWSGMFEVVDSVYLTYTALGGSATAWYLLADPNNVPVIEVAFLFGRDAPTVETGEFDFDRLGMAMRAYMDFGTKKQEYRGGVKLKGAV